MSELKFTLGPWAIEQYTPNEQVVDENTHYGIVAGTTSVATLIELSEETEANAKLIAAAPDLLECLRDCIENVMIDFADDDTRKLKYKATIDKATK